MNANAYDALISAIHRLPASKTIIVRIAMHPDDIAKYPYRDVPLHEITSVLGTPLDHDATLPRNKARVTWSDESTSIMPIE